MPDINKLELILSAYDQSKAAFNSLSNNVKSVKDVSQGALNDLIGVFDGFRQHWLAISASIAGVALAANKVMNYVEDVTHMAGKYEMLGISMKTAGANAGYSSGQMDAFEIKLRETGIAAIEARQTLSRMAASQMDLAESAKLARAAQDLAVVGGINSSEAFERLIYSIQSAQ